ncbi:ribokinase [Fredinandcohnia sp. QZ13]|uniref:ribokinase n=1 Tax=Fredinandcohnia sp. QZ13 TaxID=3073144 RepID=UPI002853253C|nr:ribokinase [Fredinandcohnia sp. QZ13]MDR4890121.1 ribokinase [Fredinandcohnia sp. QZ13]
MAADIVVVGSLNVDMVVNVKQRPEWGETVLGHGFFTGNGGKGGNQAYAAAKLGASVTMLGCVGEDIFGEQLLKGLNEVGVDTSTIEKIPDVSSGVAVISVNEDGENSIIVSPGANDHVTPEYVRKHEEIIRQAKLVMLQLEIPLETVIEVANIAHTYKVPVMLDPAPARTLPDELYKKVTYLVPNESELGIVADAKISDAESAKTAGTKLLKKGVDTVFAKLGGKGVVVLRANETFFVNPHTVTVADTTAAGDAFAGALATALVSGQKLQEATEFANAVGALAVTKKGAQASMPTLEETRKFRR